jgi:hypothetical protein
MRTSFRLWISIAPAQMDGTEAGPDIWKNTRLNTKLSSANSRTDGVNDTALL